MTALVSTPNDFICCITCDIMKDPVMTVDGNSYEREAIEAWFATGNVTTPLTGATLNSTDVIPNQALRRAILQHNEESTASLAHPVPSAPPAPQITTINFPDGTYIGEYIVINGKKIPHGRGVKTYASGSKYDGEWEGDKGNGRGVFTWANGDKYDGEYQGGKQHGRGVYTYASGAKYDGGWKDDKMHGRGVYTWGKGQWEGDKYGKMRSHI